MAKWTESRLLDLLDDRHNVRRGNGPVWAFMRGVRNKAGFDATSTIDGLAMHLWPSKGFETNAYEVKCSRSDFRRELEDDCRKSAVWRAWVDYFWIVAPVGVVPIAELPAGWGLLETTSNQTGDCLTTRRRAARLQPRVTGLTPPSLLPRTLVAAMLREAVRTGERREYRGRAQGIWR